MAEGYTSEYGDFIMSDDLDALLSVMDIEPEAEVSTIAQTNDLQEMETQLHQAALIELPPPETPAPSRFKAVTDEEIAYLYDAHQAPNTKRSTSWGMRIFQG